MIERSIGYQKGEGRVKRNKRVRTVEPVALITYNIGVVSYSFVQKKSVALAFSEMMSTTIPFML